MDDLALLHYCYGIIDRLERSVENDPRGTGLYIDGVLHAYRDIANMLEWHINSKLEDMNTRDFDNLEPMTREQLDELFRRGN